MMIILNTLLMHHPAKGRTVTETIWPDLVDLLDRTDGFHTQNDGFHT